MDSTDDLQPPCNCGALGDHPSNPNCVHLPLVEIEVTGGRSACLQALGFLRAGYLVDIKHEWQDPETEQWVFNVSAGKTYLRPYTAPAPPTPEAAVVACLDDQIGLEMSKSDLRTLTGIDSGTLSNTLTTLAAAGEIECTQPGVYRKNLPA
jgi:hypothetical protein